MTCKKSYGIALCLIKNNQDINILLIKKRYTYYFYEFVYGIYKNTDTYLTYLFNNMTYNEKLDIFTLDFSIIWYRIHLEYYTINNSNINILNWRTDLKNKNKLYILKKRKFESNFLNDNGIRLRNLIYNSYNSETIWEIPKGHKLYNESDLECAIREFEEETSINIKKINIMFHKKPYVEINKNDGIIYKNTYYMAYVYEKNTSIFIQHPKILFKKLEQTKEIENIKWISNNDLNSFKLSNKYYKILNRTIKSIKKSIKNNKPLYVDLINI